MKRAIRLQHRDLPFLGEAQTATAPSSVATNPPSSVGFDLIARELMKISIKLDKFTRFFDKFPMNKSPENGAEGAGLHLQA